MTIVEYIYWKQKIFELSLKKKDRQIICNWINDIRKEQIINQKKKSISHE